MSATLRLWRRAPAWRLCVITAVACTALAAMFPPAMPKFLAARSASALTGVDALFGAKLPGAGPAPAGSTAQAHFAPQPDPAPLDTGALELLRNAADRSGVIPFAGRQIPLPAGTWKDVILVRTGGPVAGQREVLSRVQDGQLTGLLQADAPSPGSGAAGAFAKPEICGAPKALAHEAAPEPATQNPMIHECWVLLDTDATSQAKRMQADELLGRALNRVEELGAKVPDRMLMMLYVRSDQTGWIRTLLLLPARRDITAPEARHIQGWARRYAAALHQGFDGRLAPGGPPPALGRDPT